MTQKEAIIEALNRLGGKANLNDIYRFAITLADFSGSKDWKATIRWYLQKETDSFHSTKRGNWELVSYQEEIASRDKRIKELEEENSRLKTIKTEDAFVEKILIETKKRFRHESERNKAVAVSQILAWAGREDASENLDEWLEEMALTQLKGVCGYSIHHQQCYHQKFHCSHCLFYIKFC